MDISLPPTGNNWKAIFKLQNAGTVKLRSTFLTLWGELGAAEVISM